MTYENTDPSQSRYFGFPATTLIEATPILVKVLRSKSDAASRLRSIVFCCWSGSHINFACQMLSGLDDETAGAAAAMITAKAILGEEIDCLIRRVLRLAGQLDDSGFLKRNNPTNYNLAYPMPGELDLAFLLADEENGALGVEEKPTEEEQQ